MNLYLIAQNVNNGYDSYYSAVVTAESEEEARSIHPGGHIDWDGTDKNYGTWCAKEKVFVRRIGKAVKGITAGVVCASFNAG